jgi:hypothetical protein
MSRTFDGKTANGEASVKCGKCGGGPLILMSVENEKLYTATEVKIMTKEFNHEI